MTKNDEDDDEEGHELKHRKESKPESSNLMEKIVVVTHVILVLLCIIVMGSWLLSSPPRSCDLTSSGAIKPNPSTEPYKFTVGPNEIVSATSLCPTANSPQLGYAMCEKAFKENGLAHFPNTTNGSHHRLMEFKLMNIGNATKWLAKIEVDGNFSGQSCDPTAKENGRNPECDVVVGLSDGKYVYALSRGLTYTDTLVPFPDGAHRLSDGYRYDPYLGESDDELEYAWRGIIDASRSDSIGMKLISEPYDESVYSRSHYNDYRTPSHPRLSSSLKLVLFRDEDEQHYWVRRITVSLTLISDTPTSITNCTDRKDGGILYVLLVLLAFGVGVHQVAIRVRSMVTVSDASASREEYEATKKGGFAL